MVEASSKHDWGGRSKLGKHARVGRALRRDGHELICANSRIELSERPPSNGHAKTAVAWQAVPFRRVTERSAVDVINATNDPEVERTPKGGRRVATFEGDRDPQLSAKSGFEGPSRF